MSKCNHINCPMQVGSVPDDCDIKECPYRTEDAPCLMQPITIDHETVRAMFEKEKESPIIKEDCMFFYLSEDMGKSLPYCRIIKKSDAGTCNCDRRNDELLVSCAGCETYRPKSRILLLEFEEKESESEKYER